MSKHNNIIPFKPASTETHYSQPLKSGGGGGTYDGMEARVVNLEALAKDTHSTLESIQRQLARIDSKLDAKPDTDKMYTAIFTVMGFTVAIIVAAVTVISIIK